MGIFDTAMASLDLKPKPPSQGLTVPRPPEAGAPAASPQRDGGPVPATGATLPSKQPTDTPVYDPNRPVYAGPQASSEPVNLGNDPRATVGGQLGILGNRNSEFMRMNSAKGQQEAQKRGLLNSSMAAESGIKAGLESIMPAAQQDAKLYGDALANNQVARLEQDKMRLQGQITGALTAQDYAGKANVQRMSDAAQLERINVDNEWKRLINYDNLAADQKKTLTSIMGGLGQELTGGIERILRDTNIPNKTDAINALLIVYQSQLNTAAAISGIRLTWG